MKSAITMLSNTEAMNIVDYDECGGKKHESTRVSEITDIDSCDDLEIGDIADAISDLERKRKTNNDLKRALAGFGVVTLLLAACVCIASITAARLSQDLDIDHDTGFAYVTGPHHDVLKTAEAVVFQHGSNVGEMSNAELRNLREIILDEGNLRFRVRGHARYPENDDVVLVVEGGTITFDAEGIVNARGDARHLLESMYGPIGGGSSSNAFVHGTQRGLYGYVTCGANVIAGYSPDYDYNANPSTNPWSF